MFHTDSRIRAFLARPSKATKPPSIPKCGRSTDVHVDYLSYWSLRHRPFAEQGFFHGSSQRDAIAGIHRFISSNERFVKLTGPSRCGVTRLLQHVSTMRGLGDCAVELLLSDARQWSHRNVEHQATIALQLNAFRIPTLPLVRLAVQNNWDRGLKTVWVVDHVDQELSQALCNWTEQCPEIAIIAGQSRPLVRAFEETNQIDMALLSREDGVGMIERGLQHAGGKPEVFSRSAAIRVHEISQGRIGDMVRLAESALRQAAIDQESAVTTTTVDWVQEHPSRRSRSA